MSIVAGLSREALGGLISEHLRSEGINVVLSGGSCVSIYSDEKYVSKDLDFIDVSLKSNRQIGKVLATLGFENKPKNSRHFTHPDTQWSVEFPSAPLTIGDEHIQDAAVAERDTEKGLLRLLSPTDCVKDRLANYYYFKDRQCLEQAMMVAKAQPINFSALKRWHENEGQSEDFEMFISLLKERDQPS